MSPKRNKSNDDGTLTYSEVMMLFESLEKSIRIIAESQAVTNEKLKKLDELVIDMKEVKSELRIIKLNLKNKASIEELEGVKDDLIDLEIRVSTLEKSR